MGQHRWAHIDQVTANKHHFVKGCNRLLLISQQTIDMGTVLLNIVYFDAAVQSPSPHVSYLTCAIFLVVSTFRGES